MQCNQDLVKIRQPLLTYLWPRWLKTIEIIGHWLLSEGLLVIAGKMSSGIFQRNETSRPMSRKQESLSPFEISHSNTKMSSLLQ
jgi:hypothetical protein